MSVAFVLERVLAERTSAHSYTISLTLQCLQRRREAYPQRYPRSEIGSSQTMRYASRSHKRRSLVAVYFWIG